MYPSVILTAKLEDRAQENIQRAIDVVGREKFLFTNAKCNTEVILVNSKLTVTDRPPTTKEMGVINKHIRRAFEAALSQSKLSTVFSNGTLRAVTPKWHQWPEYEMPVVHLYLDFDVYNYNTYIDFGDAVDVHVYNFFSSDRSYNAADKIVRELSGAVDVRSKGPIGIYGSGEGWNIQLTFPKIAILLGVLKPPTSTDTTLDTMRSLYKRFARMGCYPEFCPTAAADVSDEAALSIRNFMTASDCLYKLGSFQCVDSPFMEYIFSRYEEDALDITDSMSNLGFQ